MTIDCDSDDFIVKDGVWNGYKLYDLYKEVQAPYDWHLELFKFSKKLGITLFSKPFDVTAADFLKSLMCQHTR